jgi:16S rRNA (adenine1518-N6/adenine1519-N6)-dimethyltransferase
MSEYQRRKRRVLGQHFLVSAGVLGKIIREIDPQPGDLVIEIGAGRGVLTYALAERAGRVVAIEKDPRLVSLLAKNARPNVEIVAADVLDLDFREIARTHASQGRPVKVAGNLPYAISSPLLFKVFHERQAMDRGVFLVQKEVAERVCASPGSKNFAPMSIILQLAFTAEPRFGVHPGSFSPPPKVESTAIVLEKRPHLLLPVEDENAFLDFLQQTFRQRRKTLYNNLIASGRPAAGVREALGALGLKNTIRPEQTTAAQFFALFTVLASPRKL